MKRNSARLTALPVETGHIVNSSSPRANSLVSRVSLLFHKLGICRAFERGSLSDEDDLFVESQARRLGEIEIQVCSAVEVEKKPTAGQTPSSGRGNPLPPLKVHEKAKKGIVHGVQ